jgi:hypothetical protein
MPAQARPTAPTGVEVALDARPETVEAAFAAAYELLDRAFVRLRRGPRRELRVRLQPRARSGRAGLASAFLSEVEEQRRRFALGRSNTRQLEAIVGRALFADEAPPAADAPPAGDAGAGPGEQPR